MTTKIPTPEDVARGWASWTAEGIVQDLLDQGLIDRDDDEEVTMLMIEHLTDIAMSNMVRKSADSSSPTEGT